jgi:hypothetical protein
MQVALPKWPIYNFEPLQQSRQQALRAYCSNTYTVLNLTDLRIKMDSKRIPLYPFFKIVVSLLSEIEKSRRFVGIFLFHLLRSDWIRAVQKCQGCHQYGDEYVKIGYGVASSDIVIFLF